MRTVVAVLGAIVVWLGAADAQAIARQGAAAQRSLTRALNRGMSDIGGSSGALVLDLTAQRTLYARSAQTPRLPASVEKVYTTSTALLRFGPAATLTTSIRAVGTLAADGTWTGTLYLVGGGDPTFGSAAFDRIAYGTGATLSHLVSRLIASTGITAVKGAIVGDESYFDSLRGTPATGYRTDLPDVEGELSALAYDRGFANFDGTAGQRRPALYAAQQLAASLRSDGVAVPSGTHIYTGRTPSAAQTLASVSSPPMSTLISLTNTPSDNYLAEMLLKGIGARFGGAGTTAAGAAVVRATLAAQFGIHPRLNDGSGLSRSDATSPSQVVTVLAKLAANRTFVSSLALAGRTGTLKDLSQGTSAEGDCRGKTGSLHDVANQVGYCRARDGHTIVYAFMANAISDPLYVHAVEADQLAPALASYDG